jgi:1-acyl-sn-glycerol-3-phosphate acyltransferase
VLLAGNHFSFVDPVAMIRATPWPLEFLGGAETPNAPRFFHWVPKVWGRLAVYRGTGSRYAIDGGVAVLKQGGVVGIFPEAGSGAAVLRPPRPGAAFIAAQAGARIVPMGFVGMTEIFPRFREGRRARATVRIGKPIGPFQVSGRGRVRRRQLDQISDLIMQRIAELIPPEQRGFYSDDPALRAAAQAFEYAWADEPEF